MKYFISCALISIFLLCGYVFVSAQTSGNLPIITWQAKSYTPSNFQGKALPINGTVVNTGVELLSGQKLQNISDAQINWFLDGTFFGGGSGMKEISFPVTKVGGDFHSLRVSIQTKSDKVESIIAIPITNPMMVIENPYMPEDVAVGKQITLKATPYFFNISDFYNLLVFWKVNNQENNIISNILTLNIGTPKDDAQRNLVVGVTAKNSKNALEFSEEKTTLHIQ